MNTFGNLDSSLKMMYKFMHNPVDIPASKYLIRVRNTRQSRRIHELTYMQIPIFKDKYRLTVSPRSIIHWNVLSAHLPVLPAHSSVLPAGWPMSLPKNQFLFLSLNFIKTLFSHCTNSFSYTLFQLLGLPESIWSTPRALGRKGK